MIEENKSTLYIPGGSKIIIKMEYGMKFALPSPLCQISKITESRGKYLYAIIYMRGCVYTVGGWVFRGA